MRRRPGLRHAVGVRRQVGRGSRAAAGPDRRPARPSASSTATASSRRGAYAATTAGSGTCRTAPPAPGAASVTRRPRRAGGGRGRHPSRRPAGAPCARRSPAGRRGRPCSGRGRGGATHRRGPPGRRSPRAPRRGSPRRAAAAVAARGRPGPERLLGRPTGGAAAAHGLAERVRLRQVLAGRPVGDDVDPALDQGEEGLEPGQGGLLGGGVLGREHPALQRLLHGLGVGGVDRADRLLDGAGVDADVGRVVAHRGQQGRGEPRHRAEQPHPGDLAHGEVEPGLRLVDLEARGELAHGGRHQYHGGRRHERQRDLAAGEHLAGERSGALAELHREHRAVHPAQHRAGLVEHPLGQPGLAELTELAELAARARRRPRR